MAIDLAFVMKYGYHVTFNVLRCHGHKRLKEVTDLDDTSPIEATGVVVGAFSRGHGRLQKRKIEGVSHTHHTLLHTLLHTFLHTFLHKLLHT